MRAPADTGCRGVPRWAGLFCTLHRYGQCPHRTCHQRTSCGLRGAWSPLRSTVVLANVKRAMSGRYHAFKQSKYARRYLAEAQYRFNRRFGLSEMRPRLMRAMMLCSPWLESNLRTCLVPYDNIEHRLWRLNIARNVMQDVYQQLMLKTSEYRRCN